jgi:Arc/MetJ-type ribon-helix-helix transcriptional regulator
MLEALEMVRSRIFCTVREDIVRWVDEQVQKARFRNRSHAIEYALLKLKESDEKQKQES